ncbi:MAG: serine/threonine-protein kinase [Caldilineaceae bacterium]
MQQTTGRTLHHGRYQITGKLGQGGMGAVYLATDLNLVDRQVAIKENSLNAQHFRNQFLHEARLLARLNHPNLPRVTDYFIESNDAQYLVMDYVDGYDLEHLLRTQRGPLPESDALSWMSSVLDALEYMHTWTDTATGQPQPIIHRDIKPSNIKLAPTGEIFLVDFGLAKPANSGATMAGAKGITPGYSPLEQYEGGTDTRSDIYALGATLYVLLTARKPPTATELAGGTPLPPPRELNPNISRGVERAIVRAMQVKSDARFQHVRDMRSALGGSSSIRSFWPSALVQAAEETSTNLRSVLPANSRRLSRWAAAPLLLGALLIVFFFYQQMEQTSSPAPVVVEVSTATRVPTLTAPPTPSATPATPAATSTEPAVAAATATATNTASAAATVAATVAATATATRVNTPSATATTAPAATATDGPAPRGSVLPTTPPTPTRRPTSTPAPTALPTFTPTARVIATSQAAPTVAGSSGMGYFRLSSPLRYQSIHTGQQIIFQWESDIKLAEGHALEVVIWRPGGNATAFNDGRGLVDIRNTPATQNGVRWQLAVQAGRNLTGGDYAWGVLLVEREPYNRIRQLSQEDGYFRIESGGSSAPGGGGSSSGGGSLDPPHSVTATDTPYPRQ